MQFFRRFNIKLKGYICGPFMNIVNLAFRLSKSHILKLFSPFFIFSCNKRMAGCKSSIFSGVSVIHIYPLNMQYSGENINLCKNGEK